MAKEQKIALGVIQPSRWQPRDATFDENALWGLAKSIQEMGLINAIMVFPLDGEPDLVGARYELVAGERRTRALAGLALAEASDHDSAKDYVMRLANVGLTGLSEEERMALVDANIRARVAPRDDLERLHRIAVMENLERKSLKPVEEARGLQSLIDEYDYSQRELARRVGRSQGWVAQRLRLLDLDGAAQEAVNTRVLTTTHARAIATVPEELQKAMTEWAIEAVSRNDSPATTRQVANRARQVANFVDSDRWYPNGETVYKPRERNRLAAIRWALGRADLEARSEAILDLESVGYADHNYLNRSPKQIASRPGDFHTVMKALGAELNVDISLINLLVRINRTCETCVMKVPADIDEFPFGFHCPRYQDPDTEGCWGYIGPGDPDVIPVENWKLQRAMEKSDAPIIQEPFRHFDSVAFYVQAYREAVAQHREDEARQAKEERAQHIDPIRRYWEWQNLLPLKTHFQAHACQKCAHYEPPNLNEDLPPCRFVRDPLEHSASWKKGQVRAPEFGALIGKALVRPMILPRCEQFAYADVPSMRHGVVFSVAASDREQFLEWLIAIGKHHGSGNARDTIWGALRWLPYGAPRNQSQDWDKLKRWIRDHWDEPLGDVGIAALFDVMISETKARQGYRGTMTLYNPVVGKDETWCPVGFRDLDSESAQYGRPYSYPDDWPDVWGDEG